MLGVSIYASYEAAARARLVALVEALYAPPAPMRVARPGLRSRRRRRSLWMRRWQATSWRPEGDSCARRSGRTAFRSIASMPPPAHDLGSTAAARRAM